MRTRLWLAGVTLFWLAMSAWLWRAEFTKQRQPGGIPPSVVWKKMLTAPDTSNLEIRHLTNVVGYCRWRPDVGQELATGARMLDEDDPLEGMVEQLAYYTLDLEGNLTLPDFPTRLRFSLALRVDTNHHWQTFHAHTSMRPDVYELSGNAAAQTIRLHVDAGGDKIDRTFRISELQNPQKLLADFGGPLFPAMVAAFGVPLGTNQISAASLGLRWEARNGALIIGGNRVRAYRLQTKLLDRFRVVLYISPVGELLRAEFPGDITLVNEALATLRQSHD